MRPPRMVPVPPPLATSMDTSLPKRLELSLRVVLALPKASMTGFASRMRSCRFSSLLPVRVSAAEDIVAADAKHRRSSFVASVLPAPDSPLHTTDWVRPVLSMLAHTAAPRPKMCGLELSLPPPPLLPSPPSAAPVAASAAPKTACRV